MQTWVLLLRAINVGGKNLLPMARLREILAEAGCQNISTYIQSGNAVFQIDDCSPDVLNQQLGRAIEARQGFCLPLHLQSVSQLEAAISNLPFADATKTAHLFFRFDPAAPLDVGALDALTAASEKLVVTNDVVYLHAPNGIGRSKLAAKLSNPKFANLTSRNLRTCLKIQDIARDIDRP